MKTTPGALPAAPNARAAGRTLYGWWRFTVVRGVDHSAVIERVVQDSGWSGRYAFMTMMSAGIAVLGLLLSSPAVVIGAMLISPLMGPILGLGFGMALFDFAEIRRSLAAVCIGTLAAVLFTAAIVTASPLREATAEILSRTRPTLFDLLVALFAALAGTYAIIRGRGETIVGVAIATALMPPLAVVGYGLATWNLPVLAGSTALFVTNLVTIAMSAMVMARIYGFGHRLSSKQTWTQTVVLVLLFVAMAIPLAVSLRRIAAESITVSVVRATLSQRLGTNARVTQLEIDFEADPIAVRTVLISPRDQLKSTEELRVELQKALGRPVDLRIDHVVLAAGAGELDAQRAELRAVTEARDRALAEDGAVAQAVALAAGTSVEQVLVDHGHRRVSASAVPLAGARLSTYYALEQRAAAAAQGWAVNVVPPSAAFPEIEFAEADASLDWRATASVRVSAWAAKRWNVGALYVPGLPEAGAAVADPSDGAAPPPSTAPVADPDVALPLDARRAQAVAAVLAQQGIRAIPAPTPTGAMVLSPVPATDAP